MNRYLEFAKFIRPYGMLYLGLTAVFGAIFNGMFDLFHLTILFIIGILLHIFTFVQNDIFDMSIDKKSIYVSKRPLCIGSISKKEAILITVFSFLLSIILSIVFVFTTISFIFLLISFLFISIYNKYSKRIAFMEFILSAGVFTYGLFGALSFSYKISSLAVIFCFFVFFQWLFSVGVFANFKDVEYDTKIGILTTPTVLGVKIINDKLFVSSGFKIYAFVIKILHIFIIMLALLLGFTSIYVNSIPIPVFSFVIISVFILFLLKKILSTSLFERDKMLIYEGLQEGLAFLLIPTALASYLIKYIGVLSTFLLVILMIIWPLFCFRALFGKKLIPLE